MNIGVLEIFNYIKSECNSNKQELAEEVNDLIMLSDGSKFSTQLNNYWIEYCEANNICECCGVTKQTEEALDIETLEYQGFPCKQIIYEKYCPYCDR